MAHRRFPKQSQAAVQAPKAETIVYGYHAVQAVLTMAPERVVRAYVQADRADAKLTQLLTLLETTACDIQEVAKLTLDEKFGDVRHQGIVLQCKPSAALAEAFLDELLQTKVMPLLLVLDGVQDPHNLGACLRTADAAGVDAIIVPKDNAVGLTATVRNVASGAAETVPLIAVTNLARTLKVLQQRDIWIYGLDDEATDSLYQSNVTGGAALVLGAEGKGLRRLTRECCDQLLSIPMAGSVPSLNVSVAAGVGLFEIIRQRKFSI